MADYVSFRLLFGQLPLKQLHIFDASLPPPPPPPLKFAKHLRMAQVRVLASQHVLICRISTIENFLSLVILTLVQHSYFAPITSLFQGLQKLVPYPRKFSVVHSACQNIQFFLYNNACGTPAYAKT